MQDMYERAKAVQDKSLPAANDAPAAAATKSRTRGGFKGAKGGNSGITSLAVMAFLAKGHTPGNGPYGEIINRGIDFVVNNQRANGLLVGDQKARGPMYSHGISTLMLSEISGMVTPERQKKVDVALAKALKLILAAQKIRKDKKHEGGWRYSQTARDADISCTGWQIMALRSAKNNGAPIPKEAIDNGIKYVLRCHRGGGGFAYQAGGGSPGLGRTGTALLCLELCGKHGEKITTMAGDAILRYVGYRGRGQRDPKAVSYTHLTLPTN